MTNNQIKALTIKQKLRLLQQLADCTDIVITASYSEREAVKAASFRVATVTEPAHISPRMVKAKTILLVTNIMTG